MEHGWNPEETTQERRKIADGVKQRTHNELYPLFVYVADDDDGGVSWSGRSSSRKRVEIWRKLYCTGFQDLLYGLLCILWTTFSNFTFMCIRTVRSIRRRPLLAGWGGCDGAPEVLWHKDAWKGIPYLSAREIKWPFYILIYFSLLKLLLIHQPGDLNYLRLSQGDRGWMS